MISLYKEASQALKLLLLEGDCTTVQYDEEQIAQMLLIVLF